MTPAVDPDRTFWIDEYPDTGMNPYLRALRAHKFLFLAIVVATIVGSVIWLWMRTPEYRATAQVLVSPVPQTDDTFLGLPLILDTGDPTRTMQTAAALVTAPAAAAETARRLGDGWTQKKVLDAVDVQPEGQSNILDVVVSADGRDEAARVADLFVRTVLARRDASVRAAVTPVLARLNAAQSRLGTSPDLVSRLSALDRVRVAGDTTLSFSRPAVPPSRPTGASGALVVVLAFIAGITIATAVALVLDATSGRPGRPVTAFEPPPSTPAR
jgi:tyrosine-protein kinase